MLGDICNDEQAMVTFLDVVPGRMGLIVAITRLNPVCTPQNGLPQTRTSKWMVGGLVV